MKQVRNKIQDICKMMEDAGLPFVDFFYHKIKPTIQKEGIKYEILSIDDNEDGRIRISGIPNYSWCTQTLYMDETWNKKTIDKITRLVREQSYKTTNIND